MAFDFDMVYLVELFRDKEQLPPRKIAMGVWRRYKKDTPEQWWWQEPTFPVRDAAFEGKLRALAKGVIELHGEEMMMRFSPLRREHLDVELVPGTPDLLKKHKTDEELRAVYLIDHLTDDWEAEYEMAQGKG
jgi:hypothetical protein